MSFENNTKVRMTHFDISVAVNATVIIRNPHILNENFITNIYRMFLKGQEIPWVFYWNWLCKVKLKDRLDVRKLIKSANSKSNKKPVLNLWKQEYE